MKGEDAPARHGGAFWIGLAVGGSMMVYGAVGIARGRGAPPLEVARWLIGLDLAHDAVVAPAAVLVGMVVLRRVPAVVRAPLRAALFATSIVVVVAWPALRGYGHETVPDNPTVLPLDYVTGTLTVVAVVWAVAALWAWALVRGRAGTMSTRQKLPERRA